MPDVPDFYFGPSQPSPEQLPDPFLRQLTTEALETSRQIPSTAVRIASLAGLARAINDTHPLYEAEKIAHTNAHWQRIGHGYSDLDHFPDAVRCHDHITPTDDESHFSAYRHLIFPLIFNRPEECTTVYDDLLWRVVSLCQTENTTGPGLLCTLAQKYPQVTEVALRSASHMVEGKESRYFSRFNIARTAIDIGAMELAEELAVDLNAYQKLQLALAWSHHENDHTRFPAILQTAREQLQNNPANKFDIFYAIARQTNEPAIIDEAHRIAKEIPDVEKQTTALYEIAILRQQPTLLQQEVLPLFSQLESFEKLFVITTVSMQVGIHKVSPSDFVAPFESTLHTIDNDMSRAAIIAEIILAQTYNKENVTNAQLAFGRLKHLLAADADRYRRCTLALIEAVASQGSEHLLAAENLALETGDQVNRDKALSALARGSAVYGSTESLLNLVEAIKDSDCKISTLINLAVTQNDFSYFSIALKVAHIEQNPSERCNQITKIARTYRHMSEKQTKDQ